MAEQSRRRGQRIPTFAFGPVGASLSLPWKIDDRLKAELDSDISALTALATVESPTNSNGSC